MGGWSVWGAAVCGGLVYVGGWYMWGVWGMWGSWYMWGLGVEGTGVWGGLGVCGD